MLNVGGELTLTGWLTRVGGLMVIGDGGLMTIGDRTSLGGGGGGDGDGFGELL